MGNKKVSKTKVDKYNRFSKIDGTHPLKEKVPEGHVDYQARKRKNGRHLGRCLGQL